MDPALIKQIRSLQQNTYFFKSIKEVMNAVTWQIVRSQ